MLRAPQHNRRDFIRTVASVVPVSLAGPALAGAQTAAPAVAPVAPIQPMKLGVFGIPTSFLVNAKGQEIGKIVGPAEWDQPAIVDWLKSYLPAGGAAPKVKILNKETRGDRPRSRAFG